MVFGGRAVAFVVVLGMGLGGVAYLASSRAASASNADGLNEQTRAILARLNRLENETNRQPIIIKEEVQLPRADMPEPSTVKSNSEVGESESANESAELSDRQAMQLERDRVDARAAFLSESVMTETRDATWAARTETLVRDAVQQLSPSFATPLRTVADCRTTMCKIQVEVGAEADEREASRVPTTLARLGMRTTGKADIDPESKSYKWTVFMVRTGHALPEYLD